ncbi:zinc finger, CCHC-type containing protein [Tanacetum coccineum]
MRNGGAKKVEDHILLSSISVVYVLTTHIPEDGGDDATMKQSRKRANGTMMTMSAEEELTLVELDSHLLIKESLRAQDNDKPKGNNVAGPQKDLVSSGFILLMIILLQPSCQPLNQMIQSYGMLDWAMSTLKGCKMSKDGLIPAFDIDTEKTESRVLGFYVIKPNESVSINSIIESRDAIFNENIFSSFPRPSRRSLINGTKDIGSSVVPQEVTKEVVTQQHEPELRKGKRNKTPKNFGPEFKIYLIEGTRDEDVAFWKEAINDEVDSIMGNNTWVLADLPSGCKPLGCKWIFKRKLKVDGTIEKFKARLVIQGFKQKSGIDYFDTYAPVARISTIRLLIAMASIHNLIIHQMDVKTAFLNGDLDEEVYMNQPQGFIMPGNENKVCKLIKSLYGLKQAPKQWHQKFDEVVLSNGYLLNQSDKFDLIKEFLSSRFSMKDMKEADVILGIRIKHESNGIAISQSHYIEKAVSQLEYSRVIGCLMYAMTCTRSNIAFVVGKLSSGAISWASKKQTCIIGSIMESKFVALASAGKEAEWLKNLLLEIPLWSKPIAPISIRCDSAATLANAYSQM